MGVRRAGPRWGGAGALGAVAAVGLGGCGLASSVIDAVDPPPQALVDYVDVLDDSAGVESLEITRGALVTTLDPAITRPQFDAFAQASCDGDAGGPVSFDVYVTVGEDTTLSQIGLDWSPRIRDLLGVRGRERGGRRHLVRR